MEELNKQELSSIYGKSKLATLIDKVKYISGIDYIDNMIANKQINEILLTAIKPYTNGVIIELARGFSSRKTGVLQDEIQYITIENQEQIIVKKNKSVVGRAVVGGLFLGPLGALIGGMSGTGTKDVKLSDRPENILTICITDNEKLSYIVFSLKNKDFKTVEKFFKNEYPSKYKLPDEVLKEPQETITQSTISVADEIKKYKELLDMGAITQEEFSKQKNKLLGC
ncbi:MAG: SHOCT domain-containing protein [Candidatus Azobacteroides sp.]|nr:SHOCT domain-containing protein [Candidatus Azobacteroides sp.]